MKVQLKVSRELVEQWLCLGDRRIVGVGYEPTPYSIEPTGLLMLEVEAPDAPEGAIEMCPTMQRADDGTVYMLDPGWILR